MISPLLGSTTDSENDQTTVMNAPDDEHRCGWRDRAEALAVEVEDLKARIVAMERRIFGKKGESMPSKGEELRKGEPSKRNGAAAQPTRRDNNKVCVRPLTPSRGAATCATVRCPSPRPPQAQQSLPTRPRAPPSTAWGAARRRPSLGESEPG